MGPYIRLIYENKADKKIIAFARISICYVKINLVLFQYFLLWRMLPYVITLNDKYMSNIETTV